jgi:hypothetical protein
MKTRFFYLVLVVVLAGLVAQPGCKTSDETDVNQFTLTVVLEAGVSGTPAAGTYTYEQGDVVNYNYSLMSGYQNLSVTLDGAVVAASGAVTMNGNHTLTVSASGGFDIRGKWKGYQVWPIANPWLIVDLYFDIEFSGELSSGKVVCNMDLISLKQKGTYTVENGEIRIEMGSFILAFPMLFWGRVETGDLIRGDWEWKHLSFIFWGTFRLDRL